MKKALIAALLVSGVATSAHAGFISTGIGNTKFVTDDSSNQITGIWGLNVSGMLYDVTFINGSFTEIFGADPEFDIHSHDEGDVFTSAMREQAFLTGSVFDKNPYLILGCSENYGESCGMMMPYGFDEDDGGLLSHSFINRTENHRLGDWDQGWTNQRAGTSARTGSSNVYMDWSLSSIRENDQSSNDATEVPEPGSIFLFGAALVCLMRKTRKFY